MATRLYGGDGQPVTVNGQQFNQVKFDDVNMTILGLPMPARVVVSDQLNVAAFAALWDAGRLAWVPVPITPGAGALNLIPEDTDAPAATVLIGSAA